MCSRFRRSPLAPPPERPRPLLLDDAPLPPTARTTHPFFSPPPPPAEPPLDPEQAEQLDGPPLSPSLVPAPSGVPPPKIRWRPTAAAPPKPALPVSCPSSAASSAAAAAGGRRPPPARSRRSRRKRARRVPGMSAHPRSTSPSPSRRPSRASRAARAAVPTSLSRRGRRPCAASRGGRRRRRRGACPGASPVASTAARWVACLTTRTCLRRARAFTLPSTVRLSPASRHPPPPPLASLASPRPRCFAPLSPLSPSRRRSRVLAHLLRRRLAAGGRRLDRPPVRRRQRCRHPPRRR